jgi:hypothetical protein
VFVGGLTLPYDDFSLKNIDINEFYDFEKGQTKLNATTICGHTIHETPTIYGGTYNVSGANKSDIVTVEGLLTLMREIFTMNSVVQYNVSDITATSAFNFLNLSQGYTTVEPGQKIYTINHGTIRAGTTSKPMVNIIAPSLSLAEITGSPFFIHSIFDIQQSSFKVILSDAPSITGYQLSWSIGNTFSPLDAVGYMPVTNSINPEVSGSSIVFGYEQTYGG